MKTEGFDIVNRWTRAVLYHAEDCSDLPAAIVQAFARGAYLGGADLRGADLRGAYLGGANLGGAKGLLPDGIVPLQIGGSKHWIIVRAPGFVTVGCEHHPLAWWDEHGAKLAHREGYTDIETAEYRRHVDHCRDWMSAKGLLEAIEPAPGTSPEAPPEPVRSEL